MKKVHKTGGEKWAGVPGAGLASGMTLPSYIVYKCKHLYNTWCQSGPAGALYGGIRYGKSCFITVPRPVAEILTHMATLP